MPVKYKDNIIEAYLDDKKQYYDYGTASYTGDGNVVDLNHTGMSFYDQFLETSELDYLRDKKNLKGTVVKMTPKEYYQNCADMIFHTSVEKLKRERGEYDRPIIDKLHNVVKVYKRKLCMPMINYADKGQEGLHRMLAIAEMFGWNHEVPVLVVDWYDVERAEKEKKEAIQADIDRRVEKAISRSLEYKFTDANDIAMQLQNELSRQFEFDNNITVPDELVLKETEEALLLTFEGNEYPIHKDEIQWKASDDISWDDIDIDDIELDNTKDFLSRYFGKDWEDTYPHLKDTFNIKEEIEDSIIDKDVVVEVLEEHNHSYYQDSTMALEMICEKLYYHHNIDARYKGRSIYVGEKKIATIKVEREAWNMLGMYGYTLFI